MSTKRQPSTSYWYGLCTEKFEALQLSVELQPVSTNLLVKSCASRHSVLALSSLAHLRYNLQVGCNGVKLIGSGQVCTQSPPQCIFDFASAKLKCNKSEKAWNCIFWKGQIKGVITSRKLPVTETQRTQPAAVVSIHVSVREGKGSRVSLNTAMSEVHIQFTESQPDCRPNEPEDNCITPCFPEAT